MYKAVIFDLDGTLTDTLDDLTDAVNYVLRKHGLPLRDRDEIRTFIGNGLSLLMQRSLPAFVSDDVLEKYVNDLKLYYKDHSLDKTKPYDGIVPLLQQLKSMNMICAVATNKNEAAAVHICHQFFDSLIDVVKGDNGMRPLKPNADCIDEILTSFSLSKKDVLYVGDSEPDAYTAANAGLTGVGVLWGFRSKEQLKAAGFEMFAENCEELLNIIKNAVDKSSIFVS